VAAGIALNTLLAVFPALGVVVLIYGLFSSPAGVAADMQAFIQILPPAAAKLLQDQLQSPRQPASREIGCGRRRERVTCVLERAAGNRGAQTATNIAYYERERRGFLTQIAISLGFTVSAVIGVSGDAGAGSRGAGTDSSAAAGPGCRGRNSGVSLGLVVAVRGWRADCCL